MKREEVIEIAELIWFAGKVSDLEVFVGPMNMLQAAFNEVERRTLEKAAKCCEVVADCDENSTDYRNGAAWCALRIRALQELK